jgi:hypothetical protein
VHGSLVQQRKVGVAEITAVLRLPILVGYLFTELRLIHVGFGADGGGELRWVLLRSDVAWVGCLGVQGCTIACVYCCRLAAHGRSLGCSDSSSVAALLRAAAVCFISAALQSTSKLLPLVLQPPYSTVRC